MEHCVLCRVAVCKMVWHQISFVIALVLLHSTIFPWQSFTLRDCALFSPLSTTWKNPKQSKQSIETFLHYVLCCWLRGIIKSHCARLQWWVMLNRSSACECKQKVCSFDTLCCFFPFNILVIVSLAVTRLRNISYFTLFTPLHTKSTVAVAMAIMIAHN